MAGKICGSSDMFGEKLAKVQPVAWSTNYMKQVVCLFEGKNWAVSINFSTAIFCVDLDTRADLV